LEQGTRKLPRDLGHGESRRITKRWQGTTPKEETKCGTKVSHNKAFMAKCLGAQREVTCLGGKPLSSQNLELNVVGLLDLMKGFEGGKVLDLRSLSWTWPKGCLSTM
jgi:hypothetical protein